MHRRTLILSAPAIALAACGITPAQFAAAATDVATIASALAAFAPLATLVPGAGPIVAVAVAAAPAVADLAQKLAAANSTTTAQPVANQVLANVNAVVAVASATPGLPAKITQPVADIQTLTEGVLAAVSGTAGASPAVDAARGRLLAFVAGGRH